MTKFSASVWVIVALWSSSSIYARHSIENKYPKQSAELIKHNMFSLAITKQKIDTGFLTTVATTDLEVIGDPCNKKNAMRFTIKETFRNDFVTGLGSIRSTIEIISPDAVAEKASAELKEKIGKDALIITGQYYLNGSAKYQISSKPFSFHEKGYEFHWGGMNGLITINKTESLADINAKSLAILEEGNRTTLISNMTFNSKGQVSNLGLNTGHSTFSLDRVEVNISKNKFKINFLGEDIKLHNEVNQQNSKAQIITENSIGNIKIDETKEAYGSSKIIFNNIDIEGLKKFSEGFSKLRSICKPNEADYSNTFKALLKGKPEVIIDHMALKVGDSKIEAQGHLKGADLDKLSDNTIDAMRKVDGLKGLDIQLKISANHGAIALLDTSNTPFKSVIEKLIDGNILSSETNGYSANINYQNSQLNINGLSLEQIKQTLQSTQSIPDFTTPQEAEMDSTESSDEEPIYYTPNSSY